MKTFIGIAVLSFAALGLGCSSSNTATYSCNFPTGIGYCYEWTATPPLTTDQINALQVSCTSAAIGSGTFSNGGSCSSTNRVGLCTLSYPSAGVTYQWFLYSPAFNANTGQTACASSGGTWTAG